MRVPLALVLLLAAAGVPVARGQTAATSDQQVPLSQRAAFRSEVSLVLQPVAVLDRRGRPVAGLAVGDFRVSEDDVPQSITHFLAPNANALDVALLIDASNSLSYTARRVRTTAQSFLRSLEAGDCVYVLPFNERVGPGNWGHARDPAMARRIGGIFMDGGTALYDAVFEGVGTIDAMSTGVAPGAPETEEADGSEPAVHEVSRVGCGDELEAREPGAPQRRRAVVLLTDGADQHSERRFDEVIDLIHSTSIPVFPVVMGEARNDQRLREVLNSLAGNSGGAIIEAESPAELERAFDDVVVLLRASYLLGYRPTDLERGRWRQVSVRSLRPSYRLVHRPRYFR